MLQVQGAADEGAFLAMQHLTAADAAVFSGAMPAVNTAFHVVSIALEGRGCMARITTTITTTVSTFRVRSVVFA